MVLLHIIILHYHFNHVESEYDYSDMLDNIEDINLVLFFISLKNRVDLIDGY